MISANYCAKIFLPLSDTSEKRKGSFSLYILLEDLFIFLSFNVWKLKLPPMKYLQLNTSVYNSDVFYIIFSCNSIP